MGTVASVMGSNAGPAISSAQAGQVTVQRGNYEMTAAEAQDATLNIRLVKLPAGHRIVSVVLDNDAFGDALLVDVGVEDTVGATSDATLIAAAVDVFTAAGINRYETRAMAEFAAADNDRYIAVSFDTPDTTGAIGDIAVTLTSRPELGSQFE